MILKAEIMKFLNIYDLNCIDDYSNDVSCNEIISDSIRNNNHHHHNSGDIVIEDCDNGDDKIIVAKLSVELINGVIDMKKQQKLNSDHVQPSSVNLLDRVRSGSKNQKLTDNTEKTEVNNGRNENAYNALTDARTINRTHLIREKPEDFWSSFSSVSKEEDDEEKELDKAECKICSFCSKEHDGCSCSITDDSGLESAASSWGKSVAEINEHAFTKLEEELQNARETLKLRDEEVSKLSRIRQEVESEVQELTASLFQEAHSMVHKANLRQAAAEKALKESHMKVDMLMAEVSALKTLILTLTPSKPNLHLHNQSQMRCKQDNSTAGLFKKHHHRSPSHFDLKYGRKSSLSISSSTEEIFTLPQPDLLEIENGYEVDPNIDCEFVLWKENPTLDKSSSPFISRMYNEDIDLCLSFNNTTLEVEVKKAIENESIYIEAIDKAKFMLPRKCALKEVPKLCHYRMRLGNSKTYHYISQICRNRIIAVCNFLNYLRYIQRGLVKSSVHDMYWEIIKLRKEMVLARLGLPSSSECC